METQIKKRINNLLKYLNTGLYEKDEAIRLSLLCAIAGESIFFLGPPGTAKSMVSRRIQKAFKDETKYFEYLMNEFSTPDEICGPVSLKSLEQDSYIRRTEGFLPTANIAFLDEIWKSGPAILNTLLTLINEKKFHNGSNVEKVPLKILLAASNELPAKDSGLEALYDRFIVRLMVNPVTNDSDFDSLITSSSDTGLPEDFNTSNLIKLDEIEQWQKEIDTIEIPDTVLKVIHIIRDSIKNYNESLNEQNSEINSDDSMFDGEEKPETKEEKNPIYVSDRRWKKIVHLLRASAFINGRKKVDFTDCGIIWHCLWSTQDEIPLVREWNESAIAKVLAGQSEIDAFIREIEDFRKNVQKKFIKTNSEYIVESVSHYKMQSFKTKLRGNNYWFEVPQGFEREDTDRIYSARTVCDTSDSPVHYAEFKIDLSEGKITVEEPVYRLKAGTYNIMTQERPMKMSEAYDSYETYMQDVENFEAEHYNPLKNKLQSLIYEMESYFENDNSQNRNLFANSTFNEESRQKIDECEGTLRNLIFNLDKIHALYEWEL